MIKLQRAAFSLQDSDMTKIRIGLAGLGTVGRGVYEILKKDSELLTLRSQTQLEIVAVSARSKKDFVDPKIKFYANPIGLANDSEIDVVVEVIGGDVAAQELIETAIKNGKKIVTANKALLATYGFELAKLAEKHGSYIGFEASVAAAMPVIKTIKENLAGNEITEIRAILNGTSNFILTKMKEEDLDFAVALKQAQDLGYAEADPSADIKGLDTAHKITLLAAIVSGTKPALAQTYIEGIDEVSINDIKLADEFGYKIKLLASARAGWQAVYPALVKKSAQLAQVDGAYNAIAYKASNSGVGLIVGSGAGSLPTASAVVADLMDIACGRASFLFGVKADDLREAMIDKVSSRIGKYFIRLFADKNSAQERIFDDQIKIEQATFHDRGDQVLCGFLTGRQQEKEIAEILQNFKSAKFFRVEE